MQRSAARGRASIGDSAEGEGSVQAMELKKKKKAKKEEEKVVGSSVGISARSFCRRRGGKTTKLEKSGRGWGGMELWYPHHVLILGDATGLPFRSC